MISTPKNSWCRCTPPAETLPGHHLTWARISRVLVRMKPNPASRRLAAVGPMPVHGARHDAHAFGTSGLKALLIDLPAVADLGYVGVQGIELVPIKRLPDIDLTTAQAEFNTTLSKIRATVEHAIAHLKTWRILSEEGGRYRAPIEKYQSMLKAVIGLYFFAAYE